MRYPLVILIILMVSISIQLLGLANQKDNLVEQFSESEGSYGLAPDILMHLAAPNLESLLEHIFEQGFPDHSIETLETNVQEISSPCSNPFTRCISNIT